MSDYVLLTIIVVLTGVGLFLADAIARRYCVTPGQVVAAALLAVVLAFLYLTIFASGLVVTVQLLEWWYG